MQPHIQSFIIRYIFYHLNMEWSYQGGCGVLSVVAMEAGVIWIGVILEGDSKIAVIIISTLLHFQLSSIIRNSKGTFPYIQLSTLPELSAGVGWVAGGGKTAAYFHISTQISTNLSIQGIFPHFHTSTVGNLLIQGIFPHFHISTFPHFHSW